MVEVLRCFTEDSHCEANGVPRKELFQHEQTGDGSGIQGNYLEVTVLMMLYANLNKNKKPTTGWEQRSLQVTK